MSQFEYIAVAVALILTFTTARLLGAIPNLIGHRSTYWVATFWVFQALLYVFVYWWMFWDLHDRATWNLVQFISVLVYPSLTYVGACILVPSEDTSALDWRAHFLHVARQRFFALAAAGTILNGVVQASLIESFHLRWVVGISINAYFVTLYAIGFLSSNSRLQAAIVVGNALGIVLILGPLFFTAPNA